ncbi:MAG: hypothetical protein ACRD2E_12060 [Terriglobales bacterium]
MTQISFQPPEPQNAAEIERCLAPVLAKYPGWEVRVTQDVRSPGFGYKLYGPGRQGLALQLIHPADLPSPSLPLLFPSDLAERVKLALELRCTAGGGHAAG